MGFKSKAKEKTLPQAQYEYEKVSEQITITLNIFLSRYISDPKLKDILDLVKIRATAVFNKIFLAHNDKHKMCKKESH